MEWGVYACVAAAGYPLTRRGFFTVSGAQENEMGSANGRYLPPCGQQASQSHITMHIKMAQHLDSGCVLLSDPSTFGAWGPNQNTSGIQVL